MTPVQQPQPLLSPRPHVISIIVPIAVMLLSFALSAYSAYSHNDKQLGERITAIETKQEDDRRRLGEIKTTVDRIYEILISKK